MIALPEEGAPVEELWRTVVECVNAVNALLNLEVRVADKKIESGKVIYTDGKAVLSLE